MAARASAAQVSRSTSRSPQGRQAASPQARKPCPRTWTWRGAGLRSLSASAPHLMRWKHCMRVLGTQRLTHVSRPRSSHARRLLHALVLTRCDVVAAGRFSPASQLVQGSLPARRAFAPQFRLSCRPEAGRSHPRVLFAAAGTSRTWLPSAASTQDLRRMAAWADRPLRTTPKREPPPGAAGSCPPTRAVRASP